MDQPAIYELHPAITLASVRKLLDYDAGNGELTWKVTRSRLAKQGDLAGAIDKRTGHVMVTLYDHKIPGHRLAWFMHHGHWPTERLICQSPDKENLQIKNWKLLSQTLDLNDPVVVNARERARRWRAKREKLHDQMLPSRVAAKIEQDAERAEYVEAFIARETRRNQYRETPSGLTRPPREPKP